MWSDALGMVGGVCGLFLTLGVISDYGIPMYQAWREGRNK